ncbi:MAG: peptidyl-prolyl cis-trans isomerase [Pseudohongiellaceae bacterium]
MNHSPKNEPLQTRAKLFAEPLFHFAIIAVVLFGSFNLLETKNKSPIEISQREINARVYIAELAAGQALRTANIESIRTNYIEQQILVREATLRGLDNDSRIHDILDQKLRHVLSGDLIQPSNAELMRFFETNKNNYRSMATVSVDELIFDAQVELEKTTIAALETGLSSEELMTLQASSAAPLPNISKEDLSSIFNQTLADEVFQSSSNRWLGPYLSNRGQHWLQVLERHPAALPEFSEISDLLRLDWMALEEDLLLEARINEIVKEYDVVIVDDTK